MYTFSEIDEKTLNTFNEETKGHIFQTSYWAKVKKEWKSKFIGGYDQEGQLVLTSMMIMRKIPYLNQYMGYIPRGFHCDFSNQELIKAFTKFIKDYAKKHSIAFISIDPDIHLKENERIVPTGENVKNLLIKTGYQWKNTKNFENIQPNFVFRLNLDLQKELKERTKLIYDAFSKKTKYNIKIAQDRGLTVEVYDKENITESVLEKFHQIMVTTGQRDHFITRPKSYFKEMIDDLYPHCSMYMVKYNYDLDYARIKVKMDKQMVNVERLDKKKANTDNILQSTQDPVKKEKAKKKLESFGKQREDALRQIESFKKRIKEIEPFKDEKDVYIAGAVYLNYGGKGWYLYGASDNRLRDTMPNYIMQWSMIEHTLDTDCYMYDFRGVSGDLNPDNPLYGLYKFKKGFEGDFVEFIGEFDLVINSLIYHMFRFVLPKFKKIRSKLKKK